MKLSKEMIERTVTPLRHSDLRERKVLTTVWAPKLAYAWDNGPALSRYLSELKQGRIIARSCRKCDRIMIPPRMFCELCWRPTDEWVYVQDTGVINTFAVSHVDWKAGRLDIEGGERPLTPAVIEIDGASKGMGLLHLVDQVDPWKIRIGMKVKAVWKAEAEREGAITDILYFEPLEAVE